MSEIPLPEPPQSSEPTPPDSETLPGVQERLAVLKGQKPQEPQQANTKEALWDKVKNTTGIPGMNLSAKEQKEAFQLAQSMFHAHVRETLPPELRELADAENKNPADPEMRPEVQQRLAIWQDITEPEKSHTSKRPQGELPQNTPAISVAPAQPPDSENLAGVRERLKTLQQPQQPKAPSE